MKTSSLIGCILLMSAAAVAQGNFVYTDNNTSPNTVSAFRVAEDGSLTSIPGSPFFTGGNGGGTDVDPEQITTVTVGGNSFLFAANDPDGTITEFVIDTQTGALTQISQFPGGDQNGDLSLTPSPNGQFLFVTDEVHANITVLAISPQGLLSTVPGSPFPAAARSQGLKVSPDGRFLVAGLKFARAVQTFAIAADGSLTSIGTFPSSGAAAAEEVNCKSNRVYSVNAGSTLIDVYSLDDNGALAPIHGSPFSNGASSGSFALTLSPGGSFLFTGDGFGSQISSLSVAPNGRLQPVSGSPFPTADWASQVSTTSDGRFLYGALFAEGAVNAQSISPAGVLSPVPGSPFFTGQSQLGVLTLTTFPAPSCAWRR